MNGNREDSDSDVEVLGLDERGSVVEAARWSTKNKLRFSIGAWEAFCSGLLQAIRQIDVGSCEVCGEGFSEAVIENKVRHGIFDGSGTIYLTRIRLCLGGHTRSFTTPVESSKK